MPRHVTTAIPDLSIPQVRRALALVRRRGWASYDAPVAVNGMTGEDVCFAFLVGNLRKRVRPSRAEESRSVPANT